MSQELEMSVRGEIVEVLEGDTFKVKTELGFAYVWFYEEIQVQFRVGDDFLVDDLRYNIVDMSNEAVSARILQGKSGTG